MYFGHLSMKKHKTDIKQTAVINITKRISGKKKDFNLTFRILCSLRSWRYCVIVLAAEPRSKKISGDEAFEIPPARKPRYFE